VERIKKMAKESIKKRLVSNFMIVIIVTVLIFEMLLIGLVRKYYYGNVEDILINQIKISASLYEKYFSSKSLEENVLDDVDAFWHQTDAQVQIIDSKGQVLMDSIGVTYDSPMESGDFKKALNGEIGKYVGSVHYDSNKVMAISHPLKSGNEIVGVLRFVTSLKWVDLVMKNISIIFIGIGVLVMAIGALVSLFLANTIIEPIKDLIKSAEKMTEGDFQTRAKIFYNDEIGKLSNTLNYMAEEILKRERLKNDFISSVSHEIRTPLTGIKGWAVLLNNGIVKDEDSIKEGLNIIEKESERLTEMVEELLDFSKLLSGEVTIKREKIHMEKIIEYIKTHMTPIAYRKNIEFLVEYERPLPLVNGDKNKIKQVLINILDNAFKFVDENGVVKLRAEKEKSHVHILIEDNGCGICEKDLPRVKEKFYKGKNSKSKNGIGLSICDEIVKIHGGQLYLESEMERGTRVHVLLPIEEKKDEV
jgi:signal transduction histidine kinase